MGRAKAFLQRPDGTTYLEHAVRRMAECCDRVVVSMPFALTDGIQQDSHHGAGRTAGMPSPDELRRLDFQTVDVSWVVDRAADRGPAEGLARVLDLAADANADAVYCTPVDLPDLTAEDCRRLISAWRSAPESIHCGVSQPDGRLQPLVAIYPIRLAAAIDRMALSRNRGLTRWLGGQRYVAVDLPAASLRNVNTPEDLDQ